MLVIRKFSHAGCDGADQPIAEQDAEESAHQRGRNFFPDSLRRSAQRAHGDDDAKHGSDNSQAGQGIRHAVKRGRGQRRLMMMDLEVQVEHLVQIKSVDAGNGHAQGIADKVPHMMVLENGWRLGEQGTLVRLLDVVLEGHQSIFAGLVEQVIHCLQGIDVGLLFVFGAGENAANSSGNLLEDVEWIGDEDGADGGAADGDKFRGLDQDAEIPVLHQIAGDDAAEDNDNADDREHDLARTALSSYSSVRTVLSSYSS